MIRFDGVQNHAGTTRMAIRRDAGAALVRLAGAIEARFPEVAGPRSVWTTGRILLEPGAASIVPGAAEMLFQFRDADPARLAAMEQVLEELVVGENAGPCRVTLTNLSRSTPKLMDAGVAGRAGTGGGTQRARDARQRMPSGAGHDAQIFAEALPAAMLFVPSIGGISHHYAENTRDEDLVLGCQVFCGAAVEILGGITGVRLKSE